MYEIEKNIPIPDRSSFVNTIRAMSIGDSIKFEHCLTKAQQFLKAAKRIGAKVQTQTVYIKNVKYHRVWRIK